MVYKPTYNWGGTTLYELPKQCWAVFKSRNAVPLYWLLNRISEFSHHDHLTFMMFIPKKQKKSQSKKQTTARFFWKKNKVHHQPTGLAADLQKLHLQPRFQAATSLKTPLRCNDAGSIVCGFHHDPRLLRGHDHVLVLWGCEGDPDVRREGGPQERSKDGIWWWG